MEDREHVEPGRLGAAGKRDVLLGALVGLESEAELVHLTTGRPVGPRASPGSARRRRESGARPPSPGA